MRTNFFCTEKHCKSWLAEEESEREDGLASLSMAEALVVAKLLFGK